MFDPADCLAATTMISECDYNPVREDRALKHVTALRCERTSSKTSKMLEHNDSRSKDQVLRMFKAPFDIAEWNNHLRLRREAVRVEAGKYLELREKTDSKQSLHFNPAAEERDRLRALFEQETAKISGQREHIERYVNFGEKYRKMSKEWPIGFPEEMCSMHETLEESEWRAGEVALRLAEAEVEAAEWAEQLGRARKAVEGKNLGFWERVSLAIFGAGS